MAEGERARPSCATATTKPELRALTGLRAVAALAVVASHTGVPSSAPSALTKLAGWGHIGVPLFFMLSGFVLAYNYPDLTFREGRRTIRFYIARVARVMPLYWLMIAYCVAFYFAVGHEQYPTALVQNVFAVQTWSADLYTAQSRYNGPGWSIGAELFFYALFPFLAPPIARVATRTGWRGLCLVVAAGAGISLALWGLFLIQGWAELPATNGASAHRWLYRNPLPHLVDFVVGMALAHLASQLPPLRSRNHHAIQTAVVVFIIALACLRPDASPAFSSGSFGAFFIVPFAVALFSLSTGQGWLARGLSSNAMVRLGAASFALYITHRWFVWQLSTGEVIESGRGLAPYVALIATVAVLLLIAEGAHHYIEVPARAWLVGRFSVHLLPRTVVARGAQPLPVLVPGSAFLATAGTDRRSTARLPNEASPAN